MIQARVRDLEGDIGDTTDLLDDHNIGDLTEGMARALGNLTPDLSSHPELLGMSAKITAWQV
jgi:hypothetical protein